VPAGSKTLTLAQIAQHIGADIVGPFAGALDVGDEITVNGLGSLGSAQPGELTHLSGASYRPLLPSTQAGAVILSAEDAVNSPSPCLIVAQPYLAFARASQLFDNSDGFDAGIHPSAVIAPSAEISAAAHIGAHVVIEANVTIESGAVVQANCTVGNNSVVGAQTNVFPNVVIYPHVTLGQRCTVHSGAVLGADGFGFTPDEKGRFEAIAQIGGLRIGSDVSIGAGTTIDCGAIDATIIGDGVKIDNLVQIGHNCKIGDHTLICGAVGLAGSTEIGRHCVFAGGSGVAGKNPITICDQVVVSVKTTVSQSIAKPGIYSGSILASEHSSWLRNAVKFNALGQLFKRVKRLEDGIKDE
jgi:UDP-3-O-[3-hydroxymyristoyl] glucosamine N-acyltransferase